MHRPHPSIAIRRPSDDSVNVLEVIMFARYVHVFLLCLAAQLLVSEDFVYASVNAHDAVTAATIKTVHPCQAPQAPSPQVPGSYWRYEDSFSTGR